jgi:ABC-type nickel/cobalt efflux system permease component RcnA
METEASDRPVAKRGNLIVIFLTSFCAAIVMAGGFGIVVEAFVVAGANYFGLGQTFVWVGSVANGLVVLWIALWTFVRSWHVERRLRAGLEVDEPKASILANLRS